MKPSLAILIPAHNEEAGIEATIASLQACRQGTIVVIADNCTDETAEKAVAMGVRVIEREDPTNRGKPYALEYALKQLMTEEFDYFAFVDADTIVESNFVEVVLNSFAYDAVAVQVCYAHLLKDYPLKQRLLDISFTATNTLRPQGRMYWGLSCGILGNGFALSRKTLEAVPFSTSSLVEDLSYHIELVCRDQKVHYTTDTTVRAAMPTNDQAIRTQRSRWEGGRLSAIKENVPRLCYRVLHGHWNAIEPLLDLLLPPLALQSAALIALLFIPLPYIHVYAWIGLATILLYSITTVVIRKEGVKDWAALCAAPLYILWKLTLLPATILTAKQAAWKRTERDEE